MPSTTTTAQRLDGEREKEREGGREEGGREGVDIVTIMGVVWMGTHITLPVFICLGSAMTTVTVVVEGGAGVVVMAGGIKVLGGRLL